MTHEEKATCIVDGLPNGVLALAARDVTIKIIAAALAEAEERGRAAGWAQAKEAGCDLLKARQQFALTAISQNTWQRAIDAIRALPGPPAAAPAPVVAGDALIRGANVAAVDPAILERARQWAVEWPEGTATGDLARALVALAKRQSQTRIDQAVLERAREVVDRAEHGFLPTITTMECVGIARALVAIAGGSHG